MTFSALSPLTSSSAPSDGPDPASMDINVSFCPDDRKAFDAFKRAVYARPPPHFSVVVLPAEKQGGAFSYGLRICPLADDGTPAPPGSEYEIWRRWEDCLYLQDTLEGEYQTLLGAQNATNASNYSFHAACSTTTVLSAFTPTSLPAHASSSLQTYLPRLSTRGTLFRPSPGTVDRRSREFAALVHALFDPPEYAPVGVLRRVRAVSDFFGWWRRDAERVRKYGGPAPAGFGPGKRRAAGRKSVGATTSTPASRKVSMESGGLPPSPHFTSHPVGSIVSPTPTVVRVRELITPTHPSPTTPTHATLPTPRKQSLKEISKTTPFLSLSLPHSHPTRGGAGGKSPLSPLSATSSPTIVVAPVPTQGELDAKILTGWHVVPDPRDEDRIGLPIPPSARRAYGAGPQSPTSPPSAKREVAMITIERAPSPVPSVISLRSSIFSDESDETAYARDGNQSDHSDDDGDFGGRLNPPRSAPSIAGTFGARAPGSISSRPGTGTSTADSVLSSGPALGGRSREGAGWAHTRTDSSGSTSTLERFELRAGRAAAATAHAPRVVWLPLATTADNTSDGGAPARTALASALKPTEPLVTRKRSESVGTGASGVRSDPARPTRGRCESVSAGAGASRADLEALLDADVRQRWWRTHSVVSTVSGEGARDVVPEPERVPRSAHALAGVGGSCGEQEMGIRAWAREMGSKTRPTAPPVSFKPTS